MSFFSELHRRNVFRVAAAYVIISWLLIQAADILLPTFGAPEWVLKVMVLFIALGFIPAMIFSWIYELTPEGIKRESAIAADKSIAHHTGKRLDFITLAALVGVVVFVFVERNMDTEGAGDMAGLRGKAVQSMVRDDSERDRSVAILPFTTRSRNEDDAFFADGIHDDLLTLLAKIGSLKVISRTSVMEYRDTTKKIPEIARELNVANILEGSVQRSGKYVRINAQLIDAETDEHLWAEIFDRELTVENLFQVQLEIARAIANALQTELSPEEQARLEKPLTHDLQAYESYKRAVYQLDVLGYEDLNRAFKELEFALKRDPEFAAAWAELARAHMSQYWFRDSDPKNRDLAWEAIQKGRAIDPDLAQLDIAEGYYWYWGHRNYDRALEALSRAAEKLPNNGDLYAVMAWAQRRAGKFEEALEHVFMAYDRDPRNALIVASVGEIYMRLGDYETAGQYIDESLEIRANDGYAIGLKANIALETGSGLDVYRNIVENANLFDVTTVQNTWWAYVASGDYEQALEHADFGEFEETVSNGLYPAPMLRGLTHLYAGDEQSARAEFEQARAQLEARLRDEPDNAIVYRALCIVNGGLGLTGETIHACDAAIEFAVPDAIRMGLNRSDVARGLALAGETDRALDMIELYLREPGGPGPRRTALEPAFRDLREHPRFRELTGL
ncbi:MAG: tetratricopeptide repeat protein [Gammaproteobacteria bacterium]|nr:MAG: tetratricopeptide repeat protein [Gammaproteobacteria bacterium]